MVADSMNAIKIAPSILAADLSCLGDEIARAVEGGCDALHIDIMDGHFVPNLSFGPAIVEAVRKLTDITLDVHLMVDNPFDMLEPFARAGSDFLTVHVEAVDSIPEVLERIAGRGVLPGITFRPDTSVESVIPYLDQVSIVLVMSVYPGFGGQHFIEESYDRIRRISEAALRLKAPPFVSVDGGVTFDNVPLLVKAGANHLVAGTTIFENHNAVENIRRMRDAICQG
jgi:ribulose-phosphate 3-epimerase